MAALGAAAAAATTCRVFTSSAAGRGRAARGAPAARAAAAGDVAAGAAGAEAEPFAFGGEAARGDDPALRIGADFRRLNRLRDVNGAQAAAAWRSCGACGDRQG
jgi:hypothetical protein